ncbi:MAG: hypothetical protein JWN18_359 [Parcubacteria group bacterium]|nr:hypothetical protein [Parcubacteria group bacterium]
MDEIAPTGRTQQPETLSSGNIVLSEKEQDALEKITGTRWTKYGPVAMAALSALPWVGSLFSIAGTIASAKSQDEVNQVMFLWVQEHQEKLKALAFTLNAIFARFDSFGDQIKERIESEEYRSLVRKAFSEWDRAETAQKREMLRKLISNAGGTAIVDDDKVRMFIHWIEKFDELHFKVMATIQGSTNKGRDSITRREIWSSIYGEEMPRDDSSEANLYKLLIHDLGTGEVISQYRESDLMGRIKIRDRGTSSTPGLQKSPFDDKEPYVLTPLGDEFVRYVMEDLALQIE